MGHQFAQQSYPDYPAQQNENLSHPIENMGMEQLNYDSATYQRVSDLNQPHYQHVSQPVITDDIHYAYEPYNQTKSSETTRYGLDHAQPVFQSNHQYSELFNNCAYEYADQSYNDIPPEVPYHQESLVLYDGVDSAEYRGQANKSCNFGVSATASYGDIYSSAGHRALESVGHSEAIVDGNYVDMKGTLPAAVVEDDQTGSVDAHPRKDDINRVVTTRQVSDGSQQGYLEMGGSRNVSQDWLDTICRHLVEHMNNFGICVIDNFLGSIKGELILKEVRQLYSNGQYSKGRLVNNKLNSVYNVADSIAGSSSGSNRRSSTQNSSDKTGAIRNDRVIWVDGCEEGCSEINNLIQTFCSVVANSSRLSLYSNNGLDKAVINKRTKAHVACYPGNGTRYIKHIDNPNGDGRVITGIYYLNKNWDTGRDGGLLRMFPAGMEEVANIEPLFDRALFFWSDRRNPHEVLPAYRDRFAITVWFIGETRD